MDSMFKVEDWARARVLAEFAKEQIGSCNECKAKRRRIHDCGSCLAVMFATSMTEARMGLDEMQRIQTEGKFYKLADYEALLVRVTELEMRLRAAGLETGGD